jgi:hypothetical protein
MPGQFYVCSMHVLYRFGYGYGTRYGTLDAPAWAKALDSIRFLLGLSYTIYILIVFIRVREFIKRQSNIPSQCCGGGAVESCCVGYWCGCCGVSQMGRHTGDYQTYRAACCTQSGLIAAPGSYETVSANHAA